MASRELMGPMDLGQDLTRLRGLHGLREVWTKLVALDFDHAHAHAVMYPYGERILELLPWVLTESEEREHWLLHPPAPWTLFGSHVDEDVDLEFWGEAEDGLPLWERVVATRGPISPS